MAETAKDITYKAQSNLAFAFLLLPKQQRKKFELFYAFCRVIDDIADDSTIKNTSKLEQLQQWRRLFQPSFQLDSASPLQAEILLLQQQHNIPAKYFCHIIAGCNSDINRQPFANITALEQYNYRVACCVGYIILYLLEYWTPITKKYAYHLGQALQWTNILRDIGYDWQQYKRIYLPISLFNQDYQLQHLQQRINNNAGKKIFKTVAGIAHNHYAIARQYFSKTAQQKLLLPESLHQIYYQLLLRIKQQDYPVLEKVVKLTKGQKLSYLANNLLYQYG